MNIEKLKVLIPILQKTDPSEFSMDAVVGWDNEEQKPTYCLIGLLYKEHHPGANHKDFEFMDCVRYLHEYLETGNTEKRYVWDNITCFLFSGQWSIYPELNTIEHAMHRIDLIIKGYEPKYIQEEINNSL